MQLKSNMTRYNANLVAELEENYMKILTQYKCKNWQYFGNEVGQFNELIYRIIEDETCGTHTLLSEKISPLNQQVLQKWEQSKICTDDTFRILIPRVLFSMFCLRNKRGMIHKSEISPNEMDANVLLACVKWVLSELIRKSTNIDFVQAEKIIGDINTKELDLLWNINGKVKVIGNLTTKNKILLLLYDKNALLDEELRASIEYKNKTVFNKILGDLNKECLIDYANHICTISPVGIKSIESLIARSKSQIKNEG